MSFLFRLVKLPRKFHEPVDWSILVSFMARGALAEDLYAHGPVQRLAPSLAVW